MKPNERLEILRAEYVKRRGPTELVQMEMERPKRSPILALIVIILATLAAIAVVSYFGSVQP